MQYHFIKAYKPQFKPYSKLQKRTPKEKWNSDQNGMNAGKESKKEIKILK